MARPIQQTMAELIITAVETGKEATFTVNGTTYDFDPEGILAYVQAEGGFTTGTQAANITDAEVAHDVNAVFADTEVEAALDALGEKINSIIAALEEFGITASA